MRVSDQYRIFALWTPHAPFICLEPWVGRADDDGFTGTKMERPALDGIKGMIEDFNDGDTPIRINCMVVNKMDRPDARCDEVLDETLELLIDLDATDEQLDSPVIYASGRSGTEKPHQQKQDGHCGPQRILELRGGRIRKELRSGIEMRPGARFLGKRI